MPLSLKQKSNVRRHLGYPVAGLGEQTVGNDQFGSGNVGYRFNQTFAQLEYRLNNLNPDEESRLLGLAFGAVAFVGPQPNPGDTATVELTGGNLTGSQILTVTCPVPGTGVDTRLLMANLLAGAASLNPTIQGAGIVALAPYGTGPYASPTGIGVPEVAFTSPVAFTLTSGGAGALIPQITADGSMLDPQAQLDGETTIWGYLAILDGLKSAYLNASQNMDTIQAASWKGRSNELGLRTSQYEIFRGELSDFLGVPLFATKSKPARNGAMRFC